MEQSGVILVNTAEKCDLELVVSNGRVSFHRHHKLVTPHLDKHIRHEVSANAVETIQKIVCATRTFYYHLTRSTIDKSTQARIKLKTLKPDTSHKASPLEEPVLIPFGKNLISKESVTIVVDEDAMYGMTITNQSKHCLYPFVFYFDPTDLTIGESDHHTVFVNAFANNSSQRCGIRRFLISLVVVLRHLIHVMVASFKRMASSVRTRRWRLVTGNPTCGPGDFGSTTRTKMT